MSKASQMIKTSIPIFSATNLGSHLIIGGGGGGKRFGIPNSVQTLEMDSLKEIDSLDSSDNIYFYLKSFKDETSFVAICETEVAYYAVDPIGKLKKTSSQEFKEILKPESIKKDDEFIFSELCELTSSENITERLIVLVTDQNILVVLNKKLENVFQLDLKDQVTGCSFIESLKSVFVGFQSGKIMIFNLSSLEFTQSITKDTIANLSLNSYNNLFKGDFSNLRKSIFFSISTQKEEENMIIGLFTFRNRKSRIVFIRNSLDQPIFNFKELGDFQLSCYNYFPREQILILGTAEGELKIYKVETESKSVSFVKTIKSHEMPVRVILVKDLLPSKSKNSISSETKKKDSDKVEKTIEASYLEKYNKLGIWSFGVDYVCSMKVLDLNIKSKSLFTNMYFLVFIVFVLSVGFMMFNSK
jgi:hypothetical protein